MEKTSFEKKEYQEIFPPSSQTSAWPKYVDKSTILNK